MPNIRQIDPIIHPLKVFIYMDTSNTPNHRNSIPSPPTFTGSVDGNFHGLETILWPFRVYEAWHTPLIYHIWKWEGQGWSADSVWGSRLISWLGVKVKAEHAHPLNIYIWKKMDIRKVKVDHLALLAYLPCTLSLVSNLEVKAPTICAEHFGNIYFTKFSQN